MEKKVNDHLSAVCQRVIDQAFPAGMIRETMYTITSEQPEI
jgi:hypothetical protein